MTAVSLEAKSATPSHSTKLAWIVCVTCSLLFMFEFMQLNAFNALEPALMKQFHLSAANLGNLSACYMYAVVVFLFPAGMLLDRWSTRKLVIVAMAACVVCTLGFSFATSFWYACAFRFLTGVAGAFCLLSCVRLASRWFPAEKLAFVIGMIVTIAMLGGFLAQTVMTPLVDSVGWRAALRWDAGLGLLMWIPMWFFLRDFPPGVSSQPSPLLSRMNVRQSMLQVCSNSQNWFAGIYTSLMNLPIFLLGAIWGGVYLVQVHGLTREQASWVTGMLFAGSVFGSPILGALSDHLRQRRKLMIYGSLVALALGLFLIYFPYFSFWSLMLLFFLLGMATGAQVISYPLVAESNPNYLVGSAEGVASVLIMAGGFMQPLFGWLLGLHWSHQLRNGAPWYSANDFHVAMWVMPIAFFISFLCALLVRETGCRDFTTQELLKRKKDNDFIEEEKLLWQ